MARCLFLRRGGLGDTLLTTAALRALRRESPGMSLHFAGVREFAEVLVHCGVVDAAHSSEDLALWSPERARPRLAAFDLVLGDEPALVERAAHPDRIRPGAPFGLQLAQQLGLAPDWPRDAWLRAPRPVAAGGPILLAPGSGGKSKCWPRAHWLELAAALAGAAPLAVLVGPVERERDDPRAWAWPVPVAFVAPPTAVALADALGVVGAYVGNDSGPTHLAAMLAVPTVAIFGPSDPGVWAPVGPCVAVLAGDGGTTAAVPVGSVCAAALAGLGARPGPGA